MLSEKAALLPKPSAEDGKYRLVIHGGAGTMSRQRSTPEQRALYHKTLREALRTGHAVLKEGGEALDAVVAAVTVLESTLFPQCCLSLNL